VEARTRQEADTLPAEPARPLAVGHIEFAPDTGPAARTGVAAVGSVPARRTSRRPVRGTKR